MADMSTSTQRKPTIVDIMPQNDAVDELQVKEGGKYKMRYLVQKRTIPIRQEAVNLVEQLRARALKNPQIVKLNNGQNLTIHAKGTVFDEGNREANVENYLRKDMDVARINAIEQANIQGIVGTVKAEKPKSSIVIDQEQYFIKIQNLILPGNVANMHDFEDAKFDFGQFLEGVRDTIFASTKIRIKLFPNYGRKLKDNLFNGVVTFYFDEKSHAELARKELEGAIYNNYEIHVDQVEMKIKMDTMRTGPGM